jgi:hypothetical protein
MYRVDNISRMAQRAMRSLILSIHGWSQHQRRSAQLFLPMAFFVSSAQSYSTASLYKI